MEIIPYRLYTVPLFCLLFLGHFVSGQLDYNFYDHSCPNLTGIVRNGVASAVAKETRMAALFCAYTSMIVLSIGFEVIDAIKADVERACPSTVSCADILTLAVREAIYLVGGPFWLVAMGRRDGLTANETAANEQLPSPIEPLENITAKFTSKGLTLKDVVVLSGAHTIGFAQCFTFKSRLFNFDNTGNPDPTLDASLLQSLQQICPNQADSNTNLAPLDSVTTNKFDNVYYRNLVNNSDFFSQTKLSWGTTELLPWLCCTTGFPIFCLSFQNINGEDELHWCTYWT
ncbi:Peroxidase 10 [Vitis vinifera]|uniref:Peroxidase n=1 Tax=Vitis vinifera TaxID=29760 RepID=A0A438KQD1_VITVI|nr:Peroxidase 10 [Vitis vinifera]